MRAPARPSSDSSRRRRPATSRSAWPRRRRVRTAGRRGAARPGSTVRSAPWRASPSPGCTSFNGLASTSIVAIAGLKRAHHPQRGRCCRRPAAIPVSSLAGNGSAGASAVAHGRHHARGQGIVLRGRGRRNDSAIMQHDHVRSFMAFSRTRASRVRATVDDSRSSSACRRSARSPRSSAAWASAIDPPRRSTAAACVARITVGATEPNATRRSVPRTTGDHHLRNRLGAPRADLAPPLPAVDRGESPPPRSARPAAARWRDSRCRTSSNGTARVPRALCSIDRRRRRRPAPAACRRPARRWRCCRRGCRDSGSARRRPRAPPRRASAAARLTSVER